MKYHDFWDSFNVELYKKILKQREVKQDLINHKKFFVL